MRSEKRAPSGSAARYSVGCLRLSGWPQSLIGPRDGAHSSALVSGVTSVATFRSTPRPSRCPSTARRRRCILFNCSRRPDSCDFSVRFCSRERDHIPLLALKPSEQRGEEHL
jgi:hypothetical protein